MHVQIIKSKSMQIASVLGSGAEARLPACEDLTALTVVSSILFESMRLYPPVPSIARVATKDVELDGGITIKEGTGVSIPTIQIHRKPIHNV